jgi:hypothetical protein
MREDMSRRAENKYDRPLDQHSLIDHNLRIFADWTVKLGWGCRFAALFCPDFLELYALGGCEGNTSVGGPGVRLA